jgi:hypothetical protein
MHEPRFLKPNLTVAKTREQVKRVCNARFEFE